LKQQQPKKETMAEVNEQGQTSYHFCYSTT